jgi:hypothetical protein
MANKTHDNRKTAGPTIVVDNDGVLRDDINPAVDRRFPRIKSMLRDGYVEAVFVLMHMAPNTSSCRLIDQEEMEPGPLSYMKSMQDSGACVKVCTSNQAVNKEITEKLLRANGVDAVVIKIGGYDKSKAFGSDGVSGVRQKYILVEDDPAVALGVANKGIDVILLRTQYNRFSSMLLDKINGRIHLADDWGAVESITHRLIGLQQR